MRRHTLVAAAAAVALSGCGRCGAKPPPVRSGPLAIVVVDGEPIPAATLARELSAAAGEGGTVALDAAARRRAVEAVVDRTLLLREARRRGVTVGPDAVEAAVLRLRTEYPGRQFEELLAQQRLSEPELRSRLAEQLTLEKLVADVAGGVAVAPDEVARYYREHEAEFDRPAQVHALQIVVRTREEAQRLRAEVRRRPETFGEVARRASIAPEARAGGDLGWFGRGAGMPAIFDAALELPVGTVSDVLPSPYGFHLFKVVERRPAGRRPLDEARPAIEDALARQRRADAQEAFLAGLRQRATVVVDQAALDAFTP